jgi:chaperone required for assembly of F1-ATPase
VAPQGIGFAILLDAHAARTSQGHPLLLPTPGLADMVAAEWRAQGTTVSLAAMPATRLANWVLDGIPEARARAVTGIVDFAASDLVCYLAISPASLVARQTAAWTPVLNWVHTLLGQPFVQTRGVVHQDQPAATLEAVRALAAGLDDFNLAALAQASRLFGSAILALALKHGRLTGAAAFNVSRVDEIFQAEQWGADEESASRTEEGAHEADWLDGWFASLGRR